MGLSNTKKDGTGQAFWERVDGYGRRLIVPNWVHTLQSDTNLNDSDKEFTVPALKEWSIESIYIEYTSTATAGTRLLTMEIQDGASDVVLQMPLYDMIASQEVHLTYANVGDGTSQSMVTFDFLVLEELPPLLLPAGYKIRIYDAAAIAAAADDMIVHIRALQRDLFEEPS